MSADIVLVHGAWHGGWCWERTVAALAASGHRCHAPTLTGLAERAHLLRPDVDPDLHVADVTALIEAGDLGPVVLVGHSYGGLVIAGVAGKVPDRIAAAIVLDGYVPDAGGQSPFAMMGAERAQAMRDRAHRHGEGWRLPPFDPDRLVDDPADRAFVTARLTDQPLATFERGVSLSRPVYAGVDDLTFVRCPGWPNARFDEQAERLGRDARWRVHVLDAPHDVMLSHPATVAGLAADAADRATRRAG